MGVIILYHPLGKEDPRLQETAEWVSKNESVYNIATRIVDKKDSASPSHFLQDYWNRGAVLIWMAHDIVPTNEIIDRLINCEYDLCTQAAVLHPSHTGLAHDVFNNRVRDPVTGSLRWTYENEEFADAFATDLVKFGTEFQKSIKIPECSWQTIDNEMSKLSKVKAHVHWPAVRHNQRA